MPLNRIKAVLANKGVTAAQLVPYLPDCQSEACMSYITQGRANMTKDDLQAMCEQLRVKPSDVYGMKDLDYSALVTPRRPKIAQEDNRDRTAEFSAEFADRDSKERFKQIINDLGFKTWQAWFMGMCAVTMNMHADRKDGEHDRL